MEYYMKKSDRKTRWSRWIDCYNSSQKILLVGEGDFSFSACLVRAFGTAKNMVATSYLDQDSLFKKHWTSIPHLQELKRLGCLLLVGVDVYNMDTNPFFENTKFDIIIFNFPHAGHYHYLSESSPILIQMHRELVGAYFRSASKMLSEGGEVHIRHRDDPPYDRWDIVSLAVEAGLELKEKVLFDKSKYPGYHNKRGGDVQTNKTFPIGDAFTFKFVQTHDLPKVDSKNDDIGCVLEMKSVLHDDRFVRMFDGLCLKDDDDDDDDDEEEEEEEEEEEGYAEDYEYVDDDTDEKDDNNDDDDDDDDDEEEEEGYADDYEYVVDDTDEKDDNNDDDDDDDDDDEGYDEDNTDEEEYFCDYDYENDYDNTW